MNGVVMESISMTVIYLPLIMVLTLQQTEQTLEFIPALFKRIYFDHLKILRKRETGKIKLLSEQLFLNHQASFL